MTGRRQLGALRMGMLSARRELSTRPEFAAEISRLYDQSLEGMVEIGRRLNEAKAALPHGEYEAMVAEDLPFSVTAAFRLRKVAEFVDSGVIDKASLPGNYTTVFELASLSEDELQTAQARGLVSATVTRKAISAFKAELRGTVALPAPSGGEDLVLGEDAEEDAEDEAEEAEPPAPAAGAVRFDLIAPPVERATPAPSWLAPPPAVTDEDPDEPGLPFETPPAVPAARDGEVLPLAPALAPAASAGQQPVDHAEEEEGDGADAQRRELEDLLLRRANINSRIAKLCGYLGIPVPDKEVGSSWVVYGPPGMAVLFEMRLAAQLAKMGASDPQGMTLRIPGSREFLVLHKAGVGGNHYEIHAHQALDNCQYVGSIMVVKKVLAFCRAWLERAEADDDDARELVQFHSARAMDVFTGGPA